MEAHEKLLLENKAWAREVKSRTPDFFKESSKSQSPQFLWIGCSDSRIPISRITNSGPGEIFVHRNIANLMVKDDANLLSVLQYAVESLNVPHIILCGHYYCGGVKAAMSSLDEPLGAVYLDHWLENIREVYRENQETLEKITDDQARFNKTVELNVRAQVNRLAETDIIKRRWQEKKSPVLYGWVYALDEGVIKPVVTLSPT